MEPVQEAEAAGGAGTFMTEAKLNYEDLVDDNENDIEILISGVTETTQSTLLLKKKKEMREVDEALEFMKTEFRKRMELCDDREAKFQQKQAEMKAMVLRFQQFIQDNDAKRGRADNKASADSAATSKLERDAKQEKLHLEQLQSEKTDVERRLAALERYMLYLDSFVTSSEGEYDEIDAVLNRYKTLEDANKDLHRQSEETGSKIERLRQALAQFVRDKQLESLMLSSETQQAAKRIEGLSAEAAALDITTEASDALTRMKRQQAGNVISSIQNLYNKCWSQLGGPKVPSSVVTAIAEKAEKAEKSEKAAAGGAGAGAGAATVTGTAAANSSYEYLHACLDCIGQRVETLIDITDKYPAHAEAKAKEAKAKAAGAVVGASVPGRTGDRDTSYDKRNTSGVAASGMFSSTGSV